MGYLESFQASQHDLLVGLQPNPHDLHPQGAPDLVQKQTGVFWFADRQALGETERRVDLSVGEVRLKLLQEQGDGLWGERREVSQATPKRLKEQRRWFEPCCGIKQRN